MNILTKVFVILPLYFNFLSLNVDEKKKKKKKKKQIIYVLISRIPDAEQMSAKTFHLAYTKFASFCNHYSELQRNVCDNCLLRGSTTFKHHPQDICNYVKIAYSWNATNNTLKFTGVPLHTLILTEMEALKGSMLSLQVSLVQNMEEEMDKRECIALHINQKK